MGMATGGARSERPNRSLMVAIAALTLCAADLGGLPWTAPTRISGSAEVSGRLWILLAIMTIVCVAIGTMVTARATQLPPRDSMWLATLLLLAAVALLANASYAATHPAVGPDTSIPIFHWLFTFVPALLAGLLFITRDPAYRRTMALATGVATVPLLTLSWALLDSSNLTLADVAQTLYETALFGIVPLAAAVALAGAVGGQQSVGRPET